MLEGPFGFDPHRLVTDEVEKVLGESDDESTGQDQYLHPKPPNPFEDEVQHIDTLEKWTRNLVTMVETAIDHDSFIYSCEMQKYLHAGVFSGKGLFNLAFGVKDMVETLLLMSPLPEEEIESENAEEDSLEYG